jgi:hypothetical protein
MIITTIRKLDGFKPSSFVHAKVGSETTGNGKQSCLGDRYRGLAVKSTFQ